MTDPHSGHGSDGWPQGLVGAVLCGGASRRFGADKSAVMGSHVVGAMRGANIDPVVAVGGTTGPSLGIPIIPDQMPGEGPLAALASILSWANQGAVLLTPCDLPLLEPAHLRTLIDSYQRLNHGLEPETMQAAVAQVDGVTQPSVAIWPARWARAVQQAVDQGQRSFRSALTVGHWEAVTLPASALADADTREDLLRLLDSAGGPAQET